MRRVHDQERKAAPRRIDPNAIQSNQNSQKPDLPSSIQQTKLTPSKTKHKNDVIHMLTMPPKSFDAQQQIITSRMLSTSPCSDGRRRSQRPHPELSSCRESYVLFKRCSMAGSTEGYSCSDAVASYMRCAFDGCQ